MNSCLFCKKDHVNNKFCSLNCFYALKRSKTINQDFFETIDSEEKAYWLGFIYADGTVSKKENKQKSISIELSQKDLKHLEKFAKIFNSNVKKYNKKLSCKVSVTSLKLWEDIQKYNIIPNKTYIEINVLEKIPNHLKKDFIRGFFDGDGNCSNNKKMISFNSKNLKLLQEINNYFQETVGTSKNKKIINRHNINVLSFSGKHQVNSIAKETFNHATVFLERKFIHIEKEELKGVYKTKNGKWYSSIFNNGKSIYLGIFESKEIAAKEYNKALKKFKKPSYKSNNLKSDRI